MCSGKIFNQEELISAVDAVLDGWWTEGKKGKEFEHKFNSYLGVKNTIIVNSGYIILPSLQKINIFVILITNNSYFLNLLLSDLI